MKMYKFLGSFSIASQTSSLDSQVYRYSISVIRIYLDITLYTYEQRKHRIIKSRDGGVYVLNWHCHIALFLDPIDLFHLFLVIFTLFLALI